MHKENAIEWQLQETTISSAFKGLGRACGNKCKPIEVSIGNRTHSVEFYAIPEDDIPTLIGRKDLASFKVLADPCLNALVDRETLRVIATAEVPKKSNLLNP